MALPSKVIEQLSRGPARTPGWSSRVLMISSVFFFISFGTYLGITFGYRPYLKNKTDVLNQQIDSFKKQVQPKEQEDLINFYSQISNIQKILQDQDKVAGVPGWLEKNTNVNVYFSSFSFDASARTMNLSGRARQLVNVAEQGNQLRSLPEVASLNLSGLSFDPKSQEWNFSLAIVFTQNFLANLQSESNVQLESGAAATGTDTGAVASASGGGAGQDCGSVDTAHFLDVSKRTDAERASLQCFNQAVINCSPGSISISGGTIAVIQKSGSDSCIFKAVGKNVSKQCSVPLSVIGDAEKYAAQNGAPAEAFAPIVSLVSNGGGTDSQTGEIIKLDCK